MAEKGVDKAQAKAKLADANSYGGEAGASEAGQGFKHKGGSLIPPKKKLVKTMMADYVASSISKKIKKHKINPGGDGGSA